MSAAPRGPSGPAFSGLIDRLFGAFEKIAREHGFQVAREPAGGPPGYRADFLLERPGERYVAELRVAREARRPELPALLADAFVRASVGARAHRALPIALVGAPRISDELAADLAAYAARFLGGAAWGLLDGEGRLQLHGAGLDGIDVRPPRRRGEASAGAQAPELFSDLGQWMLKVLLAPRLREAQLGAPRERIGNARALAKTAQVSSPSAARLLAKLRARGFLEDGHGALEVVQVPALLEAWLRAARQLPFERPYRWLLPPRDSRVKLDAGLRELARERVGVVGGEAGSVRAGWLRGPRACVALFAACDRLGLGIVHGAPSHLYLEDLAGDSARLGLVPAAPGEQVDVFVRLPRAPEAIFRANVFQDGLPVADVLQCWLDVSDHPTRGAEQAEQLWRRVLAPALGERSAP